jgi:hypothetical protein
MMFVFAIINTRGEHNGIFTDNIDLYRCDILVLFITVHKKAEAYQSETKTTNYF